MTIATVNPFTGETVKTFPPDSDLVIEQKLQKAATAARQWRRTSFADRAQRMTRAASLLEQRKDALGRLMTLEMGKLRKAAIAELEKCANGCRYYAENAERHLAPESVQTDAKRSEKRFQPLGPVLAVMPWNFPFWQVFRFAAPALMAGNVGLLKHASNVPQCALAIEEIFRDAGFPEGVFQTLLVGSDKVKKILEDPRVAAATLTGSDGAGRSLGSIAGAQLKKTVLELGGSDPFVVLPSADLDKAVQVAVAARIQNAGQSCIAAKRFIVHEKIAGEFEKKFVEQMKALAVGDPQDEETDVGPLASRQVLEDLEKQVRGAKDQGAKIACGGERLGRAGFFFAPTVVLNAKGTKVWVEEVFGPVAAVARAKDLEEAIALANDTQFGLGAAAFTRDAKETERLVEELEAGQVFINGMVKSDPRLPFGGIKASGYGRELSEEGIREFTNTKTVWIG
ncbi:MAG TPA: NAD-dependent succinate-semialdehyde dehydrogenase [Myxococcales bacterium]|jgi:succinate-semialdehyde dehydrogenase/glutarate-semialdehyde dehydrogenase|nr:NAD-dependent succinate-semialdehyde dehydrogenase [Myxococcales bacterium]